MNLILVHKLESLEAETDDSRCIITNNVFVNPQHIVTVESGPSIPRNGITYTTTIIVMREPVGKIVVSGSVEYYLDVLAELS